MKTVLLIVGITLVLGWLALNIYVGIRYKTKNMRHALIDEQNLVGMVLGNMFFCVAWLIQLCKGLWTVRNSRTFAKE